MKAVSIEQIEKSLYLLDMGCGFWEPDDELADIWFYCDANDEHAPYIILTPYKDYVQFVGDLLTEEEKQTKFKYADYDCVNALCDDLADFTNKFFKSIKKVYERV